MDITVKLVPQGNTTQRELAALTAEATEALRGLRHVEQVTPVPMAAPEGAKGIGADIASFLLSLPPAAFTGVFGVLSGLVARSPALTTVEITTGGGVKMSFDPRRTTPEQMAELGKTLLAASHPAS